MSKITLKAFMISALVLMVATPTQTRADEWSRLGRALFDDRRDDRLEHRYDRQRENAERRALKAELEAINVKQAALKDRERAVKARLRALD